MLNERLLLFFLSRLKCLLCLTVNTADTVSLNISQRPGQGPTPVTPPPPPKAKHVKMQRLAGGGGAWVPVDAC